jgi:hypothetical protein
VHFDLEGPRARAFVVTDGALVEEHVRDVAEVGRSNRYRPSPDDQPETKQTESRAKGPNSVEPKLK